MKTFKSEKKGERQTAAGSRDAFLVSFIFGFVLFAVGGKTAASMRLGVLQSSFTFAASLFTLTSNLDLSLLFLFQLLPSSRMS